MSARIFRYDGPPRASFRVEDEQGRAVDWACEGRRWRLHGHRPEGEPVVDLLLDDVPLARLSVPEVRDLQRALDLLTTRAPDAAVPRPRELPRAAGRSWTVEEDRELEARWLAGEDLPPLALRLGRTGNAIAARLVKLGLATSREAAREGDRTPAPRLEKETP